LDDAVKSTEIDPDLIDKINVIKLLLDDVKNQVFDKFKVNLADVIPFDKITELSEAFDTLKIAMDSSVGGQFSQAAKDLVDTIIADFAALNGEFTVSPNLSNFFILNVAIVKPSNLGCENFACFFRTDEFF
jgi:hypothetical protein